MANDFRMDEAAVEELLNSPDGLVGRMLSDIADEVAARARVLVPVRRTPSWSRKSNARPPGYTLASIRAVTGYDRGHIYAGANAAADPTLFLEEPREDRTKEPFLTTALWSMEGQV